MRQSLVSVAEKIWPELKSMQGEERANGMVDVWGTFITFPFGLVGLLFLFLASVPLSQTTDYAFILLVSVLIWVFSRITFIFIAELAPGSFSDFSSALDDTILWSAVLIAGPMALWGNVAVLVLNSLSELRRRPSKAFFWNRFRNLGINLIVATFGCLLPLWAYQSWGGQYPLPGFDTFHLLIAFGATLLNILLTRLIWFGMIVLGRTLAADRLGPGLAFSRGQVNYFFSAFGLPALALPFAILAAGLYSQNGLAIFLFFVAGLLLASLLARRLSHSAERSRQQFSQLERLELLGRMIMARPPDNANLGEILSSQIPSMFPFAQLEIRLFSDELWVRQPRDGSPLPASVWNWLRAHPDGGYFSANHPLPLELHPKPLAMLCTSIRDQEHGSVLGGIVICWGGSITALDANEITNAVPAAKSLAAQIASALRRSEVYRELLALQRVEQELALAGQIQSSFLPAELPELDGWQVAAALLPARQTSGDFYDFIPFEDGKLGIVVADVADKGVGAALYMALSRTLIRTYARENPTEPHRVLEIVNQRLLADARADQFVTVFYAVLDPASKRLLYCNAGHNPGLILHAALDPVDSLKRTGIALGAMEDAKYRQEQVSLVQGDLLVLYTDGVTEAQDGEGHFLGDERFIEILRNNRNESALCVQQAVTEELDHFQAGHPPSDDITLVILKFEN
jgi:serine phosphatase RsbU (regulator of sigma subunit)